MGEARTGEWVRVEEGFGPPKKESRVHMSNAAWLLARSFARSLLRPTKAIDAPSCRLLNLPPPAQSKPSQSEAISATTQVTTSHVAGRALQERIHSRSIQ